MPDVEFGDFAFDPVDPSDFRLGVEGASKTGKSNTLAVFLEDLAETTMPTLVVERLGILSTVRTVDDDLIVVGGRDEPGIDLAVPLESVEIVAEMVLDRGLKVLLDVSTYETDDPEDHPEHIATARVLKALNENAQARLRSGDRRKCLLLVDEVHMLAPERGAPHVDLDDDVRRARAQLVTVATEGGNKGINFVAAYQRRAYTSKGVVSQLDNYVIHRLHRTDRSEAAKEIGVSEDDIANLGTGEVFIYGDITEQRVVGPVQVRRRTSPDPREETFELPDPNTDLSATLDELADRVADVQERKAKRAERIDQLEEELDRVRKERDELEEQVRTANVLEKLASGDVNGGDVPADLAAEFDELQERNEALRTERDQLQEEVADLEEQLSGAEDDIEDLETELAEYRELDVVRDEIVSNARSILRQLGALDLEAEDVREELDRLREEKEELEDDLERARAEGGGAAAADDDSLTGLLHHEAVQTAVDTAKEATEPADKHFDSVLSVLATADDALSAADAATPLSVSTSTVRKVLKGLHAAGVVQTEGANPTRYKLDREFIKQRIEVAEKQAEIAAGGGGR